MTDRRPAGARPHDTLPRCIGRRHPPRSCSTTRSPCPTTSTSRSSRRVSQVLLPSVRTEESPSAASPTSHDGGSRWPTTPSCPSSGSGPCCGSRRSRSWSRWAVRPCGRSAPWVRTLVPRPVGPAGWRDRTRTATARQHPVRRDPRGARTRSSSTVPWLRRVKRAVLRRASRVVAVSPRTSLTSSPPLTYPVEVLPSGVDLRALGTALRTPRPRPRDGPVRRAARREEGGGRRGARRRRPSGHPAPDRR